MGIASFMQKLMQALQHRHERGFAHGDIKADNIMVEGDILDVDLRLIDFGLAHKHLSSAAGAADDIWFAGIMLFEMLTGEALFSTQSSASKAPWLEQGMSPDAFARDVTYIDFQLASVQADLSEEAWDLLHKMLKPDACSRITARQALEHPFIIRCS